MPQRARSRYDRWTAEAVASVDWTRTNERLAVELGLASALSVSDLRTRLRALGHRIPRAPGNASPRDDSAYARAGIGRLSDAEVARRVGCTREAVRKRRKAMGIPRASGVRARRAGKTPA